MMEIMPQKNKILICRPTEKFEIQKMQGVTIAGDPLTCLSTATEKHFGLIIICFSVRMIPAWESLLTLCECLTKNTHTKNIPVLGFSDVPHRGLICKMADAGVKYAKIQESAALIDPEALLYLVQINTPSVQIKKILNLFCPFLDYAPIDDRCELITCKGYRNRLVLGGARLHEVCETGNHLHCDYFINAKVIT